MDHREQHQQHKEKVRDQKIKEERAYEEEQQKNRLPIHPAWLMVGGVLLTLMAVYVWTFWLE
jgi:hypothetical protein